MIRRKQLLEPGFPPGLCTEVADGGWQREREKVAGNRLAVTLPKWPESSRTLFGRAKCASALFPASALIWKKDENEFARI